MKVRIPVRSLIPCADCGSRSVKGAHMPGIVVHTCLNCGKVEAFSNKKEVS